MGRIKNNKIQGVNIMPRKYLSYRGILTLSIPEDEEIISEYIKEKKQNGENVAEEKIKQKYPKFDLRDLMLL